MRLLGTPPASVIDPATGALNAGSFRGGLPPTDLSALRRGGLFRLTHDKRWVYFAIAADELLVAVAVVDLGYASNAFAFAYERSHPGLPVDWSALGPPLAAEIGESPGEGCHARFWLPGSQVSIRRPVGSAEYDLRVRVRGLDIDARISAASAPPAIGVVAPIPGGVVNTTEKRSLLAVTGEAVVDGVRHSLDGAIAGYDYTHGYLARHTSWRWAFGLGRAKTGERVAFNLVEGFVGEAECVAWVDGEIYPLPEGRFDFDPEFPREPWAVRAREGGAGASDPAAETLVDLRFEPGGLHAEEKDFVVIASRFMHPVGVYSGTLRVGGRELELDRVLGVAEDQDVLW